MSILLDPLDWTGGSDILCDFGMGKSRLEPSRQILRIGFSGTYRAGSRGNPDAEYMSAMCRAALQRWMPDGLVFDLAQLRYTWGDTLEDVLSANGHPRYDGPYGMAVVVGPDCRDAVRTLLLQNPSSTEPLDAIGWVFTDLDAAWCHVERELAGPLADRR